MRRLLLVLAAALALAAAPVLPASAGAGNWAVTYLDPLPDRIDPGTTYTVGYWVLQHGTHPFDGQLGRTALKLSGPEGKVLTFDGTAQPEAGHYVTAVSVPKGTWTVQGIQGEFDPYAVGTLTVPGRMKLNPIPEGLRLNAIGDYWGAIRPPGFPAGKATAKIPAQSPPPSAAPVAPVAPAAVSSAPAAPDPAPAAPAVSTGFSPIALLLAAAGGALVALIGVRLARRHPRDGEEANDKADTITISG